MSQKQKEALNRLRADMFESKKNGADQHFFIVYVPELSWEETTSLIAYNIDKLLDKSPDVHILYVCPSETTEERKRVLAGVLSTEKTRHVAITNKRFWDGAMDVRFKYVFIDDVTVFVTLPQDGPKIIHFTRERMIRE